MFRVWGTTNRLLVATIGFDERPVIRAVLRHGLKFDKMLLLRPREPSDPRSNRVIENIRGIIEKTGMGVEVTVGEVTVNDFYRGVGEIKKHIMGEIKGSRKEILLLLGGGMRSLVLETLVAAIQLSRELLIEGLLEVDIEGSTHYTSARIEDLVPLTISPQERRVLEELAGKPRTLAELVSRLDIPKTTLWKILRRLEEKRLVIKEYADKNVVYRTTPKTLQYMY